MKFIKTKDKNIFILCNKTTFNSEFLEALKNIGKSAQCRIFIVSNKLSEDIMEKGIEYIEKYVGSVFKIKKQNDIGELFVINSVSHSKFNIDLNHLV
ncbi:MAG: hypothetical protein PHX62_00020 [Bacilli bacterium]|nr:hypothetical protein [Bacilli bacterium]